MRDEISLARWLKKRAMSSASRVVTEDARSSSLTASDVCSRSAGRNRIPSTMIAIAISVKSASLLLLTVVNHNFQMYSREKIVIALGANLKGKSFN
jgi:hypothetical protein